MKRSYVAVCIVLSGTAAWAQDPLPQVVPFPLDVKRMPSGTTEKERDEMARKLPMQVRAADAEVPDAAKLAGALSSLKRQDCDRENECLSQLAKLSGALYGLYVSLDYTLEKRAVASGRVVRDDGMTMGPAQTVELPVKNAAFKVVAQEAVKQLLAKLELRKLSPFRPVPVPETPAIENSAQQKLPPPVPPPLVVEDLGASQRSTGKVVTFAGAGVAVAGAVVAAIGGGIGAGATPVDGYAVSAEAARRAATGQTLTTVGFVGLGLGAVTGVVGAVLWNSAAPAPVSTLGVVPVSGGGVVQVGGAF